MTPFSFAGLLTGISSIGFGLFVLFMSQNRKIAKIWFLFTLSVAGWGFGVLWIGYTKNAVEGLLAWRIAYALGVIWIAPLFYHFVCIFLDLQRNRAILLQYFITTCFLLTIPSPLFFCRVRWVFNSFYYGLSGKLYPFYFAWWIGLVLYSHLQLIWAYKMVSPKKKIQIKYFIFAMAAAYGGGSLAYLPNFGIDVYPWGTFAIVLYPVINSIAIAKHRLMDISVIIRKTLTYSFVTGTLIAIYLGTIALFTHLFEGLAGYQTIFSSIVAAALITFCFQPLRKKVQSLVDSKFFRQYVDREQKLYELSRDVITHTTPEAMAHALIQVLQETLHPKSGALYLRSREGNGFVPMAAWGDQIKETRPDDNPLAQYFSDHPQPFIQDTYANLGYSRSTRNKAGREDVA